MHNYIQAFSDLVRVLREVNGNPGKWTSNSTTNTFKTYLTTLDPLLLWPITEKIKKKVFKADFEGCDVHMHNLKSGHLVDVQVVRNASLDTFATRYHAIIEVRKIKLKILIITLREFQAGFSVPRPLDDWVLPPDQLPALRVGPGQGQELSLIHI